MTTATPATADRIANRAPKGGAVSAVNGRFYRGGWFMPMVAEVVEVKPAVLEGSARQVAWAARLRKEALARLALDLECRRMSLAHPRMDGKGVRQAIRRDALLLHRLTVERSAVRIIDRRAALMA